MMAYQNGTGLAGFDDQDAQDAADHLAKMGQEPPAAPPPVTQPPPMVPGAPGTDASAPPTGNVATPAPPDASVPPAPSPPPAPTPDATATAETPAETGAKAVSELGPPPPAPKYTGDPTKDVQLNLGWQRQLTDYSTALAKKQGDIAKSDAEITQRKAEREADAERAAQAARQAQVDAYQQERQQRQQQIDDAVKEKQAAYADLKNPEGQSWADRIGGAVAIALGGIGQGLMLKGHVAGAQNEGLNAVNKQIADDTQRRKDRLAAASASVLEARYGFKDAAENYRAGLNDLDTDRAAKYRLIASEAEEQLRAGGASDQDIKTNQVVVDALKEAAKAEGAVHEREEALANTRATAAATNKMAEAHLNLGERQLEATQGEHAVTNALARGHLTLAQQEAQTRHEDRMAALAEKAKAEGEKATVGSVRQNAVLGNLAEAEKAEKDIGPVSLDAINRLQTNTEQAKAGEHSAESGVTGNLLTRAARGLGLTARGQYDGIDPEEQKKITAANQVITHLTEMQQGKNIETLEQYRDRYSPYVPGLSIDEVRRREAALPGLVAEQRAIQDPKGTGTKRTAKLEQPAEDPDVAAAKEHLGIGAPKAKPATPPTADGAVVKQNGHTFVRRGGQWVPQ
jgi:hypothetical protein